MELIIADKKQAVITISQSQYKTLLKDAGNEINVLVYGKSGTGKSAIVEEYAKEAKLNVLIFSLATEMPEAMGGIPHAVVADKVQYFARLLDERLAPLFDTKGKGYILFFDEINQALPEILNTLYSICHPDPKKRNWYGHSLEFVQIIAAGNLMNGDDGTVYLTEPPTPLHNRFHIFEVVADDADTKAYLRKKWKNISQVAKFIDAMLAEKVPPRDIDEVLKTIAFEKNPLWVSSKIGEPLAAKLFDIQKRVKSVDPAELLKNCRALYKIFKDKGEVMWSGTYIYEEQDLLDEFAAVLTEEEIKSIVKGVE